MNQPLFPDCVVFGGTLVEQVVQVPRLPKPKQDNVPMSQMAILPGGSGANVAVYLSRLNTYVRLLDQWGIDDHGRMLETALEKEGVEIRYCQHIDGLSTPYMIILTLPNCDWTGITRISPEAQLGRDLFAPEVITGARFLHFHGFSLSTENAREGVWWAIDIARRSGVQISIDACTPVAVTSPSYFRELLSYCRLFFANTHEAYELTGEKDIQKAANFILMAGTQAVVIKAGADGCYFIEAGQSILQHCPAVPVDVVDTIGAGDAVVAGVISALCRNLDLGTGVQLGTAAAALVCQGIGAQSRIFNLEEAWEAAGLPLPPGS